MQNLHFLYTLRVFEVVPYNNNILIKGFFQSLTNVSVNTAKLQKTF